MIRQLIQWSLNNPIVVILLAIAFAAVGLYSFEHVNVESYPDPAPAIVEVYAQFPGASAEEVERMVTIPLEVTFAGMPGLKFIHSKSLFGLADLKMNWNYGSQYTYEAARQEVINRMALGSGGSQQPLPPGVIPTISPESPTGEIYRYVLTSPKDESGHPIYTLNDIKAMEDYTMEREFRTVPRVVDLTSYGGTIRRYEVQPDPDRLRLYGVTLGMLQNTLGNSNTTVGGDYVMQGQIALTVRSVGLFGGGLDPVNLVLGETDPQKAAKILRAEENRRIREIRSLVITSVNNRAVRVEDVVEGGRIPKDQFSEQGVVVKYQTRLGCVGYWKADRSRPSGSMLTIADVGHDDPDMVQCIVLMRKGEQTMPALRDVKKRVEEVNSPDYGRRLPGVEIEHYYDRTDLLNVTTETVTENMLVGVLLIVVVLFMFVSNIRTAIIVAINIPLALLFAFTMLFARDKSANLLSIGAVDFGIIVDSSVIMVENIYRHLAAGNYRELPLKDRIMKFVQEIDSALLFSTLIMVCAFVPLFTMSGAEGELFRPMAQTYAFSLGAALVLTMTLTPVLCMLFFKKFKPVQENFFVRFIKARYLFQLKMCLKYRWATVILMTLLIGFTATLIPRIGHEFMPELEEGNLWIRSTAPLNQSLERNIEMAKVARNIMANYPEVESIVTQSGRPDDGTDIEGYENTEYFVPLRPRKDWPAAAKEVKVNEEIVAAWRNAGLSAEVVEKLKKELQDKKILVEKMKTAEGETVVSHRLEEEMSNLLSVEDYKRWREPVVKATVDESDKHVSYLSKIFPTIWPDWRPRSKEELIASMNGDFHRSVPGVVWNFSQNIRDNVMESLSGFKGDNSLKIFGPDFEKLEVLANKVKDVMQEVPGMVDVGVIHEMGQSHLQFRVDPEKCERYGTCTADVNNVISSALGARAMTEMVEGEKQFDIAIRWPLRLRNSEVAILDIPLDLYNNTVVLPQGGSNPIPAAAGYTLPPPSKLGTLADSTNQLSANAPRVTLRDVISPVAQDGSPDARFKITDKTLQSLADVKVSEKVLAKLRGMKEQGFDTRDTFVFAISNVLDKEEMKLYQDSIVARASSDAQFVRAGAAAIFREQGKRLIAIKFGVRGRDLGSTVADAKERLKDLIKPPYRTEWAGEFEQMEDAQGRLMWIVPISLGLIFILLYMAFRSILDAIVIFTNVFDVAVGGIWALYLTGTTFSVSAAVGFVSLFGIAIMEGLLLISYFNALRAEGLPLNEAIMQGAAKRVRPVMITALTAILGLLPAALSDKIGAQTARPLAIVVIGGMSLTLFVNRYLMPVLYTFYGNRTPPEGSGSMAH